ncbi:MAG: sulfurtransferase TusA family protein [Fervidicoccaceae archaeon]|nr:MAG: SirA family protein [Fervidicoccus sp.]
MGEKKLVDARGMACPGPIAKLTRAYREAKNGDIIEILATDQGFIPDIKSWVESTGNKLLELGQDGSGVIRAVIEVTAKK